MEYNAVCFAILYLFFEKIEKKKRDTSATGFVWDFEILYLLFAGHTVMVTGEVRCLSRPRWQRRMEDAGCSSLPVRHLSSVTCVTQEEWQVVIDGWVLESGF
ncbi:hypothetical protein TB2_022720 [Malus domestica]